MTQEQKFRNKVNTLSAVLAVLVVFFHSNAFLHETHDNFACRFQFFICNDLAQGAVPTFFALSGFLFYRNFDMSQLLRKWKSRVHSLVIPYLFWNAVYTAYFWLVTKTPFVSMEAFPMDADHLIKGILFHEYNGPFWYMLQLILLTVLCPLLYYIMKKKWTAIPFMACMYGLYAANITSLSILQTRAVIYYTLGVFFAMHYPKKVLETERVPMVSIVSFVLAQVLIYSELPQPIVYITIRILLIVAYAGFANLFGKVALPRVLQCSFPVYAMHDIFVETLNKVFSFFVSPASNWILLDFFCTTAITIAICIGINELLQRITPRFHGIIFGGRTR